VGDRFLLVMSDHIFDPALLAGLRCRVLGPGEVVLAVDRRLAGQPFVDLDDVTRVRTAEGRIAAIGKKLENYDAFDTGAFLCTPALFQALERRQQAGDYSLSGGIKDLAARGQALTWDAGDLFWLDVDDEAAVAKAEQAVAAGLDRSGRTFRPARRFPGWARIVLTGSGLVLLVFLLLKVGLAAVLDHLAHFGPWFLVVVAVGLAWLFLQAWAWHIVQATHFRTIPLMRLFRVKIISDSLNTLIPTANIGGDAARPFLIQGHAPLAEGIPGVLADKTIEALGAALFLATGFLLSLLLIRLPAWMTTAALVCLLVTVAGIALFIVLQLKGLRWALDRVGRVVPSIRTFVARRTGNLEELDRNLRVIYRGVGWQTVAALGLHYAARVLGAVEVFVILRVLGTHASPFQALFTSTGVTLFNTAFFVVPGQFGVMETAHIVMLRSMGFTAAMGLSLGVIRRIRKLVTSGLGLWLYAMHKSGPKAAGERRAGRAC